MRPSSLSPELLTFAHKTLRAAQASGLSQDALAAKARVHSSTLSNAFGGHDYPTADQAFRMARALGVPLDWLLDPDQAWPPPSAPTAATSAPSTPSTPPAES